MTDYQQRVLDEKVELDLKLERLETFLKGEKFKTLDGAEKDRMQRQAAIMRAYSSLLKERIDAFTEGTPTIIGEK